MKQKRYIRDRNSIIEIEYKPISGGLFEGMYQPIKARRLKEI